MGLDSQAMLEVNRALIYSAARAARQQGTPIPLVLSVATFGRGIRQEVLAELERYRHAYGHNQSLVSLPPVVVVAELLKRPEWDPGVPPPGADGFWALGYAFGRTSLQWWGWDEHAADALF